MSLLLGLYSAPSLGLGSARTACATSRAHACMQQQQQPGPPYAGPRSTPLLDTVSTPNDLKGFSLAELKQLSHELRWETINAVSKTGGHLGSSIGVVELTVALHYVFNTPADPVIWDVSHQARAPPSPGREAAALHLHCSTAPSASDPTRPRAAAHRARASSDL